MKPLIFLCVLAFGCAVEPVGVEEEVATAGEVDLEWAIFDGPRIVSCIDASASELRLVLQALDRDAEQMELVSCYAGIDQVGPIAAGDYDVEVRLVSPAGGTIDTVAVHDVTIVAGHSTPLGPIAFAIGTD